MPCILIVDDQAQVRTALAIALRANGIEVVAVEDAHSGLREFAGRLFDLAIIDLHMPGVDGVKLIKTLRERSPGLPIIAMSGVQLNESERTALDLRNPSWLPFWPRRASAATNPQPLLNRAKQPPLPFQNS